MLPSSCLDGSITPVGPGQNPQYTGAVQRREAVGCSQGLKNEPTKQHGSGVENQQYVDDVKLAGKKQNLDPMWKVLNKEVDLGEPTSFLDHVYLGCTQRKYEISKHIVDNYRTMFESRISAGE